MGGRGGASSSVSIDLTKMNLIRRKVNPSKPAPVAPSAPSKSYGSKVDQIIQDTGASPARAQEYKKALEDWSGSAYKSVRSYQQGKPSGTDAKNLANTIEEYIDKAPKWQGGETYRGISDVSDSVYKALTTKGATVDMRGTASWSKKESVAKSFAKSGGNDIVFVCKTQKRGTDIERYSVFGSGEAEVLVSKSATYSVGKTKKDKKSGITYIYLNEN